MNDLAPIYENLRLGSPVQGLDQLQRQSFVMWVWNTWDAEPKS